MGCGNTKRLHTQKDEETTCQLLQYWVQGSGLMPVGLRFWVTMAE